MALLKNENGRQIIDLQTDMEKMGKKFNTIILTVRVDVPVDWIQTVKQKGLIYACLCFVDSILLIANNALKINEIPQMLKVRSQELRINPEKDDDGI